MRRLVVVLGVLAAAAALAAPASAEGRNAEFRGLPDAGPTLAGSRVVWGEGMRRRLRIVSADRRPEVIYRIARPRNPLASWNLSGYPGALAASSTHLAFVPAFSKITQQSSDSVSAVSCPFLAAGPLGGLFGRLSGIDPGRPRCRGAQQPRGVSLDGSVLAYFDQSRVCGKLREPPPCIVVRELTTDTITTVATGNVRRVRLAGRYLAWSEERNGSFPHRIVVHDLVSGRKAYHLSARRIGARFFEDFDLQDDGTIAFVSAGSSLSTIRRRLAWASIAQPRPHLISRSASELQVEIADSRILYERIDTLYRDTLILSDLGGKGRVIARFDDRRGRIGEFDFDGDNVTWASIPTRPPPRGQGGYPERIGPGTVLVRKRAGRLSKPRLIVA